MEKKNKKRSKRKIAAIVCLILVVLVAGAAGSAYSVFKMKFYDKSNYVRRGTYVAAANTEKKAKEGEKQDVEVWTFLHSGKEDTQCVGGGGKQCTRNGRRRQFKNSYLIFIQIFFCTENNREKRKQYAGKNGEAVFLPKRYV